MSLDRSGTSTQGESLEKDRIGSSCWGKAFQFTLVAEPARALGLADGADKADEAFCGEGDDPRKSLKRWQQWC